VCFGGKRRKKLANWEPAQLITAADKDWMVLMVGHVITDMWRMVLQMVAGIFHKCSKVSAVWH